MKKNKKKMKYIHKKKIYEKKIYKENKLHDDQNNYYYRLPKTPYVYFKIHMFKLSKPKKILIGIIKKKIYDFNFIKMLDIYIENNLQKYWYFLLNYARYLHLEKLNFYLFLKYKLYKYKKIRYLKFEYFTDYSLSKGSSFTFNQYMAQYFKFIIIFKKILLYKNWKGGVKIKLNRKNNFFFRFRKIFYSLLVNNILNTKLFKISAYNFFKEFFFFFKKNKYFRHKYRYKKKKKFNLNLNKYNYNKNSTRNFNWINTFFDDSVTKKDDYSKLNNNNLKKIKLKKNIKFFEIKEKYIKKFKIKKNVKFFNFLYFKLKKNLINNKIKLINVKKKINKSFFIIKIKKFNNTNNNTTINHKKKKLKKKNFLLLNKSKKNVSFENKNLKKKNFLLLNKFKKNVNSKKYLHKNIFNKWKLSKNFINIFNVHYFNFKTYYKINNYYLLKFKYIFKIYFNFIKKFILIFDLEERELINSKFFEENLLLDMLEKFYYYKLKKTSLNFIRLIFKKFYFIFINKLKNKINNLYKLFQFNIIFSKRYYNKINHFNYRKFFYIKSYIFKKQLFINIKNFNFNLYFIKFFNSFVLHGNKNFIKKILNKISLILKIIYKNNKFKNLSFFNYFKLIFYNLRPLIFTMNFHKKGNKFVIPFIFNKHYSNNNKNLNKYITVCILWIRKSVKIRRERTLFLRIFRELNDILFNRGESIQMKKFFYINFYKTKTYKRILAFMKWI